MLLSMTWPCPDWLLSSKAARMPRAQVKLPPAKSARRLTGGRGFSCFRPRQERTPHRERYYLHQEKLTIRFYFLKKSIFKGNFAFLRGLFSMSVLSIREKDLAAG